MWESEDDRGLLRFRCRTGHGYSIETLAAEQTETVESAMWSALRTLEERAAMAHRMATRLRARGSKRAAGRFEGQAGLAIQQAVVIREALQHIAALDEPAGQAP